MRQLTDEQQREVRRAVRVAGAIPALVAEIESVYRDLEIETSLRRPRCDASGRCCHFDEFGHLLFVSTAELAVFHAKVVLVRAAEGKPARTGAATEVSRRLPILTDARTGPLAQSISGGCVYQVGNLCSVHDARPFGCRIFFCDSTAQEWQKTQYDRFHRRLKQIHEEFGIPYLYVEWRQALAAISEVEDVEGKQSL